MATSQRRQFADPFIGLSSLVPRCSSRAALSRDTKVSRVVAVKGCTPLSLSSMYMHMYKIHNFLVVLRLKRRRLPS